MSSQHPSSSPVIPPSCLSGTSLSRSSSRSKCVRFHSGPYEVEFTFSGDEYDRTCLEPATPEERAVAMPERCMDECNWLKESPILIERALAQEVPREKDVPLHYRSPTPSLTWSDPSTDSSDTETELLPSCLPISTYDVPVQACDMEILNNATFDTVNAPRPPFRRRQAGRVIRKATGASHATDNFIPLSRPIAADAISAFDVEGEIDFEEYEEDEEGHTSVHPQLSSGINTPKARSALSVRYPLFDDEDEDEKQYTRAIGELNFSCSPTNTLGGLGGCALGVFTKAEVLLDFDCLGGF